MSYLNVDAISIVHWFHDVEKHRCGYCKGENCSASNGMWAETMTVEDYQNLIDRGWRRSGKYCYKPIMDETCCPQYTIRCDVDSFNLSKSQKKVIKKFNKFLSDGVLTKKESDSAAQQPNEECYTEVFMREKPQFDLNKLKGANIESLENNETNTPDQLSMGDKEDVKSAIRKPEEVQIDQQRTSSSKGSFKPGEGADPTKPPCKKAKLLRLEKKQQKMLQRGMSLERLGTENTAKTLEDFLNEVDKNAKHKLKIKIVSTSEPGVEWNSVKNVEFELYKKYQMQVHNDPPEKCTLHGFTKFLVTSPLKPTKFENVDGPGYGSFHQQYWLDDKLIAVGVIDILPRCISSVYFFYDPDYRNLTLGTYGSLRELQFVRSLREKLPSIKYYYMGFYIHSCPKMRYKGKLNPSFLLCPESYEWTPIEKCIPKLEANKYSRLNDDIDAVDVNFCEPADVDAIKVLIGYKFTTFANYKHRVRERDAFNNIGRLVGKLCARSMLFVVR